MRKLDFILQTILLGTTLLFLGAALLIDKGFLLWIGILQFLIGCEQLLSGLITIANSKHSNAMRTRGIRTYWILVLSYFALLAAFYLCGATDLAFAWFFTAWGIAIYYYVFTIKLAFKEAAERKTFFDVVN